MLNSETTPDITVRNLAEYPSDELNDLRALINVCTEQLGAELPSLNIWKERLTQAARESYANEKALPY